MKVKSMILIILFILLFLLSFTQIFATGGNLVQIPMATGDTNHIDIIDTDTRVLFT